MNAQLDQKRFPYTRPKDAATLIVIRPNRDGPRLLMGRRSDAHVFMPGAVVFPGGKVDRADRFAAPIDELHSSVAAKLALQATVATPARARAIAMAAIRETAEETGILIGRRGPAPLKRNGDGWQLFAQAGLAPTIAPLRLVARAITPPGMVRRFDARFFAVFADAIGGQVEVLDHEMEAPAWLSFEEARAHAIPHITRTVLDGLEARLSRDPCLETDQPVPFYRKGPRGDLADVL